MNRDAGDLRESLFDAVFQRGGDVVDFSDGQCPVQSAMARDQDLVLDEPHAHIVAVGQFVKVSVQPVDENLDIPRKVSHLASRAVGRRDVSAQRLDMDVHVSAVAP